MDFLIKIIKIISSLVFVGFLIFLMTGSDKSTTPQINESGILNNESPRSIQTETKIESIRTQAIKTVEPKKETQINSCNPNYSGCLKINAGDYDCASGKGNGPNYTGPVQVLGYDEYDLDRDHDGLGCEN